MIIDRINYAAYHETDFSLHDSDKNRLFGSEHYNSSRPVYEQSPWAEGNFEEKMAMLLCWANVLNRPSVTSMKLRSYSKMKIPFWAASSVVRRVENLRRLLPEPNSDGLDHDTFPDKGTLIPTATKQNPDSENAVFR